MRVLSRKQIFEQYKESNVAHGMTFSEIILASGFPREIWPYIEVRTNGSLVIDGIWDIARPHNGVVVSISTMPKGGGDSGEILKTAVTIAVAYYTGDVTSGLSGAFAVAGATMATGLLLNSMFPPPQPELTKNPDRTSVNSITGQSNRADPYGVVLRNYGTNKVYPRVVAEPFTYYVGDDQYLIGIYDFGLGEQNVSEPSLSLGDNALVDYNGIEYNIASNPSELTIYKNKTNQENFAIPFENIGDSAIRTSPINSSAVELKFDFPGGLTTITGRKNKKRETTLKLNVKIKPSSSSIWSDFSDYDFEIDKKYVVDNFAEFPVQLRPQIQNITKQYLTRKTGQGAFGSFSYLVYEMQFSSNIIDIIVDEVGFVSPSYGYTEGQPIRVGDSIVAPGAYYGPREKVVKVLEIISVTPSGHHNIYRTKVSETIEFDMNVSYSYSGPLVAPTIASKAKSFNSTIAIKENTTSNFKFNLKINPNVVDQWDLWVYWQDTDFSDISSRMTEINDFTWFGITGFESSTPIAVQDDHTYIELKIKATDQLNGAIQNFSAEVTSVLDYYDDIAMIWKRKKTSNPAWVFVDILTGTLNQRAVSKSKIDIDSIVAWAKYCEENIITYQSNETGFECNFVLDYSITVKEILSQVCSVGRATLNINSGKYGVLIDELKSTPTQIFNQRNIKSLKVSRAYHGAPDAVSCIYIDPASNWQKNEVIAYDDGKDINSSEIIEEIEMFATTDIAQAWRQGRYFLAQQKLRQNNISIGVDFENLACSRGDLVLFSHDVMKQGGLPARVISISGNEITLDEPMSNQGGTYILRARVRATDEVLDLNVLNFTDTHTVEVDNLQGLQWDDLIVFGEVATVTREYIVKAITFGNEYDASLELIEYAPAIYDADIGVIPDYETVTNGDPLAGGVFPPAVTDLINIYSISCSISEKRYVYTVSFSWEAPVGTPVDNYEIYLEINGQQQLVGFTKNRTFVYEVSAQFLNIEHTFKIIGVDGAGRKMPLQNATSTTVTPLADTQIPEDVIELNANVLTETIELDWTPVTDCDVNRYYIRYSPKTSGAIWAQSVKVTSASSNQNSIQVPLRTGTYFVKAQDWAGNVSANAAFVRTQIPEILNLDFISEVIAPTWDGVFEDTELIGEKLKLKSIDGDLTYTSDIGNFYFSEVFDLGSIFTARFTSSILASGYSGTSLMKNWITLASIPVIAGNFTDTDYDVSSYIRTRNDVDTMSNWTTLSAVDYLSFGNELTATPWKKFSSADFAGRIFQLKLQLEGNDDQTVSPVVFDSKIEANWVDRIAEGRDILSGTVVLFDGAFVSVPALQVTAQENVAIGDYYLISNKTVSGFTVQFYDKDDIPTATPKYDWIAKGFGKKYTLEDINF
tara:strand:- start:2222 stop:6340 length:4119 start_codon:yes stop_codon:yes gene_type:complete